MEDLTYLGNNLREDTTESNRFNRLHTVEDIIQENYYYSRKYVRRFLDRECTLFNLPTFTKALNSSTLSS